MVSVIRDETVNGMRLTIEQDDETYDKTIKINGKVDRVVSGKEKLSMAKANNWFCMLKDAAKLNPVSLIQGA